MVIRRARHLKAIGFSQRLRLEKLIHILHLEGDMLRQSGVFDRGPWAAGRRPEECQDVPAPASRKTCM